MQRARMSEETRQKITEMIAQENLGDLRVGRLISRPINPASEREMILSGGRTIIPIDIDIKKLANSYQRKVTPVAVGLGISVIIAHFITLFI